MLWMKDKLVICKYLREALQPINRKREEMKRPPLKLKLFHLLTCFPEYIPVSRFAYLLLYENSSWEKMKEALLVDVDEKTLFEDQAKAKYWPQLIAQLHQLREKEKDKKVDEEVFYTYKVIISFSKNARARKKKRVMLGTRQKSKKKLASVNLPIPLSLRICFRQS